MLTIPQRTTAVLAVAALAAAITACSSSTDLDAAGVIQALTAQGVPSALTVTYTEETDPNSLLGRPGGYASKAGFDDQRAVEKAAGAKEGDVGRGGGVEVYEDAGEAEKRAEYISALAKSPLLAEYTYVRGNVVLRISKHIPPNDAKVYESALAEVVK